MKDVSLLFLGFIVGCVFSLLFTKQEVKRQLSKNEPVKVETKIEVKYVLGEKKECEDKGGNLDIRKDYTGYDYTLGKFSGYDYSVTCTRYYEEGNKYIVEIFDYKI